MPFAGYTNFDDCVSRNRDKRDPDAYCGSIKHKVEDKALGNTGAQPTGEHQHTGDGQWHPITQRHARRYPKATPKNPSIPYQRRPATTSKALDAARAEIANIKKLFGRKPAAPKGPVQNPPPAGIPAKVYHGKGFSGVAPAQRHPGAPHPGLARGAGRMQKQRFAPSPADPKRGELPKRPSAAERYAGRAPGDTSKPPSEWSGSRFNPRNKPVKKNGGGATEEATPELADVTMIGSTLQSVSNILSEHAKEHHDLDKKKTRQPTVQPGPSKPAHKPHGQVKPRQQRGAAHGQRVAKQHPDEYPEEWGPKELYQKVGDEVKKIDKHLSLKPLTPKPPSESHRHVGKPRPDVPPAYRYTHEAPPGGTRAHETWRATQKALDEVKKAVGGCPAGWHKHEPYDYCHPTKRAHRGATRMKPAGGVDDAHGVIDQAIVQAHAIGSKVAVEAFRQIKDALAKYGDDPERSFKALSIWQNFYTKTAQSVSDPRQRMAMSMVADVLRRAAAKAKPKPEAAAHADVQRMDDKQLSRHYDALINYLKGDQARQLAPNVHQEYIDRLKAVNAELGRRAGAH